MPQQPNMEEELVFLRRELEQERLEKTYLRSLLNQLDNDPIFQPENSSNLTLLDAAPSNAEPRDAAKGKDDIRDVSASGRLHARAAPNSNDLMTSQLLLKQTEEKLQQVEFQLLHAEETICHLKAEKLEALRRIEHLATIQQRTNDSEIKRHRSTDIEADEPLQLDQTVKQELHQQQLQWALERQALEKQLVELQNRHLFEQETKQEVIREQEEEIQQLHQEIRELTLRWECHQEALATDYKQTTRKLVPFEQGQESHQSNSNPSSSKPLDCEDHEDRDDEAMDQSQETSMVLTKNPSEQSLPSSESYLGHENPWKEEVIRHPTPQFDLESYEVQYLLQNWTKNLKKIQFLRLWLMQVAQDRHACPTNCGLPVDFPLGIELPGLRPEIRDGFLTLVVPLLRRQTHRSIQVHTRDVDGYHSDLRIRVLALVGS